VSRIDARIYACAESDFRIHDNLRWERLEKVFPDSAEK
jgi:hypothetical protein